MTSPVLLWRNGKEELLSRTKTPWEEGNIEPRQSSRKSEAIQIFWKLDKDEISLTWSRMILQIENFLGNKSPHRTLGGWDWSSRGQSTSLTGWMDETEGVSVPLLTGWVASLQNPGSPVTATLPSWSYPTSCSYLYLHICTICISDIPFIEILLHVTKRSLMTHSNKSKKTRDIS